MRRLCGRFVVPVLLLAGLGGTPVLLRALTNAMLFHPTSGQARVPSDLGMPHHELWVTADDGVRTQLWWIEGQPGAPVLLMFHGNAGTMADRLDNVARLHARGFTVATAEYRGYGEVKAPRAKPASTPMPTRPWSGYASWREHGPW